MLQHFISEMEFVRLGPHLWLELKRQQQVLAKQLQVEEQVPKEVPELIVAQLEPVAKLEWLVQMVRQVSQELKQKLAKPMGS